MEHWQNSNTNREEKGNRHLNQLAKTLVKLAKDNTYPNQGNKKYQTLLIQLWKEAIMSQYIIDNHEEEKVQDTIINLINILSEDGTETSNQTKPDQSKPSFPTPST